MRIGFVGPSYTAASTAVADEECINWYAQTTESQASIVPTQAYGGKNATSLKSYFPAPGLTVFCALPQSPVRGSIAVGGNSSGTLSGIYNLLAVAGGELYAVHADGTYTALGAIVNDGQAVSMAFNSLQVLIVGGNKAYCFTVASNTLTDVTASLAGYPVKCDYSDTYFIVQLLGNKFQMSQVLDGTTWPGTLVNEVSVFAENIYSIICNHRELWVLGQIRSQPYQDTGSAEVFDVIPGTMLEKGCVAPFAPCLVDNSVFWIDEDARGGRSAWRSQGYVPIRISTYAVETDLASYTSINIASMTTYAYQDNGHLFWVLYIPGSQWSWVYDDGEGLWHKRAYWNAATATWTAHRSWNHSYAYNLHLVGDWATGNLYSMSTNTLTDNGNNIRRLRRSPTISNEMSRVYHAELTLDFDTGQGPQPPLVDGNGNPRQPQALLRWSDDRGKTWGNQHVLNCGYAGQYRTRAIQRRLGQSRYRVYELSVTDPIPWVLVDAYLRIGQ